LSEPDDDLIRPAEFRPADPRAGRGGRRLPLRALVVTGAFLVLAGIALFMFVGRPVQITVTPAPEDLSVSGGPAFALGERFLLLTGTYRVRASLAGHHPLEESIEIGPGDNGPFEYRMRRLPGRLQVDSAPVDGIEVRIDGEPVGVTPLRDTPIEPGERSISLHHERWLPASRTLEVEGMGRPETLAFELEPAWADVRIRTEPPGAELRVDGEPLGGETPMTAEILAGVRELGLHLPGYKTARERLELEPGEDRTLAPIRLEKIDGLLRVTSRPAGATVTVDGVYRGSAPLEVELAPGSRHRVELIHPGHQPASRSVDIRSGEATELDLALTPIKGQLQVDVKPADARLIIDGTDRGTADQQLELVAVDHRIEIRREGYVPWSATIRPRPGIPQEIRLELKTLEQARIDAIEPEITSADGQRLLLLRPEAPFEMGASRREPGRRANEVLRQVEVTRPFYLATTEVTNARFRAFADNHDSGAFEDFDLDGDTQPAVNLSWSDAARFCNWLSRQDDLPEVYRIENDEIVGFDPDATGYRLPTEAEWAWTARIRPDGSTTRFPWGDGRLPPANRLGNFADRAASHLLARTIPDYLDGQAVTGPVAGFDANARGFHDLGGNAAEWVNDFYGATDEELPSGVTDPLGPPRGEYHVIRGSSWMHGQLVDLRWTFRDYGNQGRDDVGFRIARWLE
jgi:formylglycine-generating enzyme required for sulfatase activity